MIGLVFRFDSEPAWTRARETFAPDSRLKEFFAPFATGPDHHDQHLIHRAAGFGALAGFSAALVMQVYSTVVSAPLDVGGRPLFSWPAYIPVCFVLTLLGAGVAMTFTLFIKLKMPWLNHPVFAAPDFDLSENRFYLFFEVANTIEAQELHERLRALGAASMAEVPCA